jgi:hypothetical protein
VAQKSDVKTKVFLSRTFRTSEKNQYKAADYFSDLIKTVGLEPIQVISRAGEKVDDHILSEIRNCDLAIGIFTKRHKLEGNDKWTVPINIIYELGIACALNLRVAGFLDRDIPREELAILNMAGWDIIDFDYKTMYDQKERERFISYLEKIKPEVLKIANPYQLVRLVKEIEIHPDGYSVITHSCQMKINDLNVRKINHMFGLSGNSEKDAKFPSFKQLLKEGPKGIWNHDPFFSFRVVDLSPSSKLTSSDFTVSSSHSGNSNVEFSVNINKEPEKGMFVQYEWSFGFPNLFPTTKNELAPGKRKKDMDHCESVFTLGHGGIMDLEFRLVFFEPCDFESPPLLRFYDSKDNRTTEGASFDLIRKANKLIYTSRKMNTEGLTYGQVKVQWIPS